MGAKVQIDSQIMDFAKGMELATGMDHNVILAHWRSEEPIDTLSGWQQAYNNPAGIRPGDSAVDAYAVGTSPGGFDIFPTPDAGFHAYAQMIEGDRNYQGIRDAIKTGDPIQELKAIAASPWDAGHYGGDGHLLFDNYSAITGGNVQISPTDSNPAAPDPNTPQGQTILQDIPGSNAAKAATWIKDKLGINASPIELLITVLGSVGILLVILMLFKGNTRA